jgi:hypothetical protein
MLSHGSVITVVTVTGEDGRYSKFPSWLNVTEQLPAAIRVRVKILVTDPDTEHIEGVFEL